MEQPSAIRALWAEIGLLQIDDLHDVATKGIYTLGYKHFSELWEALGFSRIEADNRAAENVQEILVHERTSSLLLAYGLFEGGMNRMATDVLHGSGFGLKLTDFTGSAIERAKFVLRKFGGVRKAFSSPDWEEAKKVSDLRHQIIHCGGVVDVTQDKHKAILLQEGVSTAPLGSDGTMIFSVSNEYLSKTYTSLRAVLISASSELREAAKCSS